MKVAIITLHRIYNYGSALQTYATQKLFENMGHEVRVIHYITPQRTLKKTFLSLPEAQINASAVKRLAYRAAKVSSIALKELTFGRFVRAKLHLTKRYITAEDLDRDPPVADLYITGSDQTWNSTYNEGVDRGFFLDFIPAECRRIAFVSSFGKEALNEDEKAQTRYYLSRYQGISVREDSAVRILEDLGIQNGVQLIDPTLQIPREQWLSLASKRLIGQKYLLLFLLYNEDENATAFARQLADSHGWKVVKLSWEMRAPAGVDVLMTHRSPEDFLSLMQHAEFVVTNSFHGLAFSVNLEKQFVVVPRREFNSRIESLLRLTGLENRMTAAQEQLCVADTSIDYDRVRGILQEERSRAARFLETYTKAE